MKKENVLVLVEKKHKGGTRTHLLSLANNPTPYVVCSNYQENDYNTCSWDWAHYHTNITSALFTFQSMPNGGRCCSPYYPWELKIYKCFYNFLHY